jgi:hypothetical protein
MLLPLNEIIFITQNQTEIQAIVHLVCHYYRQKPEDFCVITPYDAQQVALEKQLKAENLPWERVFNVDSFQGQYTLSITVFIGIIDIPIRERRRLFLLYTQLDPGSCLHRTERMSCSHGARLHGHCYQPVLGSHYSVIWLSIGPYAMVTQRCGQIVKVLLTLKLMCPVFWILVELLRPLQELQPYQL